MTAVNPYPPLGFRCRLARWNHVYKTLDDDDLHATAVAALNAVLNLADPHGWPKSAPGKRLVMMFVAPNGYIYVARIYSALAMQVQGIRRGWIVGLYDYSVGLDQILEDLADESARRDMGVQQRRRA